MNTILGSINIFFVYYCEANNFISKIKLLLFNFFLLGVVLILPADQKVDTKVFQTLCMHVFNLDLSILKSVRLGPKINNKHRPLLLTVEDLEDKIYLISHSHFLRRHDQYKSIFIPPDRTKLERLKHKKSFR